MSIFCRLRALWCAGLPALGVVLSLCLGQAAWGQTRDRIAERALFEDAAATMAFQEVRRQPFVALKGDPQGLLQGSTLWVRLLIDPARGEPGPAVASGLVSADWLVLRVTPAYLSEVALHDELDLEAAPRLAGLGRPTVGGLLPSRKPQFLIPVGDRPRHVWVRLKADRIFLAQFEALPLDEALRVDARETLQDNLLMGLMLLCLVFGVFFWVSDRDPATGWFVARQSVACGLAFIVLGYANLWGTGLSPAGLDMAFTGLLLLLSVTSVLFFHAFLQSFHPPAWTVKPALPVLLAAILVAFLLWLAGEPQHALRLHFVSLQLIAPVWLVLMIVLAPSPPASAGRQALWQQRAWLWPILGLLLVTHGAFLLRLFGVGAETSLAHSALIRTAGVTAVLVLVLVRTRAHRLAQQRDETLVGLRQAQLTLEIEQERRQEKEEFLAMLTHELKTPLSVLRLALGAPSPSVALRQRADRAVQDMSNVIDRCAQVEMLHGGGLSEGEHAQRCAVAELRSLVAGSRAAGRVDLSVSDPAPAMNVDGPMFRIIAGNLIENALKYGAAEHPVRVRLRASMHEGRSGLEVAVANAPGPSGWPDPDRVFTKYYRSTGARHQTGSGLGLHLAERLAARQDGALAYRPDDRQVCFVLWLPA